MHRNQSRQSSRCKTFVVRALFIRVSFVNRECISASNILCTKIWTNSLNCYRQRRTRRPKTTLCSPVISRASKRMEGDWQWTTKREEKQSEKGEKNENAPGAKAFKLKRAYMKQWQTKWTHVQTFMCICSCSFDFAWASLSSISVHIVHLFRDGWRNERKMNVIFSSIEI